MTYTIEKEIKRILKERGIQQKYLCEKVGISIPLFNQSLNCKRELKATELISVCFYLGIDLNKFKNNRKINQLFD